jgi:glutaminyl-peptide cyclotransferase
MRFWLAAGVLFAAFAVRAQTPEDIFSGKAALAVPPAPASLPAMKLAYTIVKIYPHDTAAFTEGLFWHDGYLYESVGMEGQSEVRKVDLKTGKAVQTAVSPDKVFGEGVVLFGDQLIQLTFTEGRALVYDFSTMRLTGEFHYAGEGWGLTTDGKSLIMSNGSDLITYRDPSTFAARRRIRVKLDGKSIKDLNELEFVEGNIWANIWKNDLILRIDPASGRVTGVLDMAGLLARTGVKQSQLTEPEEDVLNGIAYDPASGHFFVTGKCWPSLFEIKIDE